MHEEKNYVKPLYKKAKTGKVQLWKVSTSSNIITVTHGQLDGKQQSKETVCEGKNIGRSNETTPAEQAVLEAQSKWNKQKDKGYFESIDDIKEIPLPMLAHDFLKQGHRIKFPCDAVCKLNGIRALCTMDSQGIRFISRGGKPYQIPEHILEALQVIHSNYGDVILDGELYCHGMPLEDIVSSTKKHNDNTSSLEYHVFDVVNNEPWSQRRKDYYKYSLGAVKTVPATRVENMSEVEALLSSFEDQGYEGVMLRNLDGMYTYNQRSADLQKLKNFKDAEFKIIAITEDKNQEAVFTCESENGTFDVKMKGSHEERQEPLSHPDKFINKALNVKYQALTKLGIPQFPVGMFLREGHWEGFTFYPSN